MSIDKQAIVEALEKVISGEVFPEEGLCRYLGDVIGRVPDDELVTFLCNCFITWPEFSGHINYPVPSPWSWWRSPIKEYMIGEERRALYIGRYGEARLRLAQHIINCIKSEEQS